MYMAAGERLMNIPGNDSDLREALLDVNTPTLLLVLASLTGDDKWLAPRFAPAPIEAPEGSLFPDDTGRYSDELTKEIHEAAVTIIGEVRDGQQMISAPPRLERFHRMLNFSTAETVDAGQVAMLMEETRFVDRDEQWRVDLMAATNAGKAQDFHAVIIGAGMSGLGIAAKLKSAGLRFTILEKNSQVGGTWYENRYPDCGVDTPNHFYSYSFHRNPGWSGYFSKRDELFAYFDDCADAFDVREQILFECEVEQATFDEASNSWQVSYRDTRGARCNLAANVVISAVGQLNRPALPDIQGLETFSGPMWHSARWQDDSLEGKKVGVIGTGCSSVQLLPKTAEQAQHSYVFQRTPHWVAPARDYYRPVEQGLLWALEHIPYYAEFHRARMILIFGDRSWPVVVGDPEWPDKALSMNEANHGMREALIGFIKEGLGDKNQYLEDCTPAFPVWGKRLIVDNGWYETLAREDVSLVTETIECITPEGIKLIDGRHIDLDVLILATGFQSNRLLTPMEVLGVEGRRLADVWGDSANAYKGTSVPGFPNLFCLYGPNTNIVHGGSIIYQIECQIHYTMQCITQILDQSLQAIDVRAEINTAYNKRVQSLSRNLAWGHANVTSWYKNSAGEVVNNSPFSLQEFWATTHDVDLNDYRLLRQGSNG